MLQEATGLRVATLAQLAHFLKEVPEGCIYYHLHQTLFVHQRFLPAYPNDFAYWVSEILGEKLLGEKLAGVEVITHPNLEALRAALAGIVDEHLAQSPTAHLKFASEGEEFFFIKSLYVVLPTPHRASTLAEFVECLKRISLNTLYFHIFDARLRLGQRTNDFAIWLEECLGLPDLARQIAALDPYAHTLESLRGELLRLTEAALTKRPTVHA